MKNYNYTGMVFLLIVICAIGCRKKGPADMPKLYPCSITVTMGGAPLDTAMIYLQAKDESQKKWYASGYTDQNGVCQVKTSSEYKGAPAGDYIVVVTKEIVDPEWKLSEGNMTPPLNVSCVPLKYCDPQETPLAVTVEQGKNELSLDLEPLKTGTFVRYRNYSAP